MEERRVELYEARLSIQMFEALEDGGRFVIPKTMSEHLCQVVSRVNYPFQKCQHGCPQILEFVPEILQRLPLLLMRLLVSVSDVSCGDFEEGSHINGILPWDGVEISNILFGHHVS